MPPVALPPKARAVLYYVIAIAGAALGSIQTVYLSIDKMQPLWLTITLSVYGFMAAAFGVTAASHTPTDGTEQP
jgi:hypothetical protein